jgi:hypothetical protein
VSSYSTLVDIQVDLQSQNHKICSAARHETRPSGFSFYCLRHFAGHTSTAVAGRHTVLEYIHPVFVRPTELAGSLCLMCDFATMK